jgi:hypothetical protein
MKVHCHLCGATLRHAAQYQQLLGSEERDAVYICRDEQRCQRRAEHDPLTLKPHPVGGRSALPPELPIGRL